MLALRLPWLGILALFSLAHAQTECIYTTTVTSSTMRTSTKYVASKTVTSEFFSQTAAVTSTAFVTSRTTHEVDAGTQSTVILNKGTRTLGGYKYTTKSCPVGPTYILACSSFSATADYTITSYTIVGTTTISVTWTSTSYIPRKTTVITTKIKTGTPASTITSTITRTQATVSRSTTITRYNTVATVTYTAQQNPKVLSTTHTTSLATPTATATKWLFSLQITNTSNTVDGNTWGQIGPVTGSSVVIQNKSVWRYYIDPASQFLVHAPSGNVLGYTICTGEECYYPFVFTPDVPQPANDGSGDIAHRVKCEVGCGDLLQCWDADESDGRQYVTIILFDALVGSPIGITPWGGGLPANLRAVGPTKGK